MERSSDLRDYESSFGDWFRDTMSERIGLNRPRWLCHMLRVLNTSTIPCPVSLLSFGLEETTWESVGDVPMWNENMYNKLCESGHLTPPWLGVQKVHQPVG